MDEDSGCVVGDGQEDSAGRKRRKRLGPNKRWTEEEVTKIIQFLLDNQPVEEPSAISYYQRLMSSTQIFDVPWTHVRWKVRNLKANYQKALQWQKSLEDDDAHQIDIKAKIFKVCPHFLSLRQIFLQSIPRDESTIFETASDEREESVVSVLDAAITEAASSNGSIDESQSNRKKRTETTAVKVPKMTASRSVVSQLSELQAERAEIQRKRLKFEKQKYNIERNFTERRLRLEEERLRLEQENKREELQLRKLELEIKERLGRYELELKYNST